LRGYLINKKMDAIEKITKVEIINDNIIKELIDKNVGTYKLNNSRIVSDYWIEKSSTESYNGRQLLELLQNADDAETDKIIINIDFNDNILSISNNGVPFSSNGLNSLMLAYLSSKNKKEFIGNKGLGFRSILNWVDSVKVKTKEYIFEFSPDFAKKQFETIISDEDVRRSLIENEKKLKKGEIPFAILAIPDYFKNYENQEFETIIELKFKKSAEKDLREQLKAITPEILLFLKHTESIQIIGDEKFDKIISLNQPREKSQDVIAINDKTWNLFNSGELIFPEIKDCYYSYKIAWQDSLEDRNTFFTTYFPTNIQVLLPCIIHATFNLTPDRNYLTKSDENDFVLKEIAKTLCEIAENILSCKDDSKWKPYMFLNADEKGVNKIMSIFYETINELKPNLKIFPTVNGKYVTEVEVKFYGNQFSLWVIKNNLCEFFQDLLLPIPEDLKVNELLFNRKFSKDEWLSIITDISPLIDSVDERIEFISLILNSELFELLKNTNLPLLLTQENKVAKSDIEVFALQKSSVEGYDIPKYVNIAFLDDDFYNKLLIKFEEKIIQLRNDNEHKSRTLKRIISPIVNMGSNDITDVIKNISKAFLEKIKEENISFDYEIKLYVRCLFNIFKKNPDRKGTLLDVTYLYNRKKELVPSNNLFIGKEYESGKITELLFDKIYAEEDYVIGNEFWELSNEDNSNLFFENFFLWLGANKFTKYKKNIVSLGRWNNDYYSDVVFKKVGYPQYKSSKSYNVDAVENFDKIITSGFFCVEKLIAWICIDSKLYSKLSEDNKEDYFEYSYGNNTTEVKKKPSFFISQIIKSGVIDDVFIDIDIADVIGLKTINIKHDIFKSLNIDEISIQDISKKIGIKMSFNDFAIEMVYSILEIEQVEYKKARKIYQLVFNYFKSLKLADFSKYPKQKKVLAEKNGIKEYKETEKVYYSDNATLPSRIIEDLWIFDFPKRSGEKQVFEFFGLKTFKDLNIEIRSYKLHDENNEFQKWFNKIKPYILTYRLNSLKKGTNEIAAVNSLKNVKINIVSELNYIIHDNVDISIENKELQPNEFINNNRYEFFICGESELIISVLKEIPSFCEAFSEALCVLFEVYENKDDYRAIFKDKDNLKDTKYLIDTKMLQDKFEDACNYLGLSKNESEFWKIICKIKNIKWNSDIASYEDLKIHVLSQLKYNLPLNYALVNFADFDNEHSYKFLSDISTQLSVGMKDIKSQLPGFKGLLHWHKVNFLNKSIDYEILWNKAWWLELSTKPESEQKKFIFKRKSFNHKVADIIEQLTNQFELELTVNYEKELSKKILEDCNLNLQNSNLASITIENKYQNIANLSIMCELSDEIQSLFYFEGNIQIIEEELSLIQINGKETKESNTNTNKPISLIKTSILNGKFISRRKNNSSKNPDVHSEKTERQKKKAGERAEKIVRDKLKESFPNGIIQWVSGNSDDKNITQNDRIGYDIRYKKDKTDLNWIFLEVKSISGKSFIISTYEVQFGIENNNQYQIALVDGSNIYLIDDFFMNEDRIADFNSLNNNASIKPLDFEVYFAFSI